MRTRIGFARPLATLAVLALFAPLTPAQGQDATKIGGGRTAIVQLGRPHHVATALDSVPHPWPGVALSLSALGTALPIVIGAAPRQDSYRSRYFFALLGAEIVTPAAGHLYAGLGRRAAVGMISRAVGFSIAAAGGYNRGPSSEVNNGDLAIAFGTLMVAVSAVWDIMSVPGDVEARNREWLDTRASLELRSLPSGRAPALAMTVRF